MDFALLDAIQDCWRNPFLDAVMPFVTHLGDLAIVWFIAAAVLLMQPKRRTYGLAVVIAVIGAAAIGAFLLKPLFARVRPYEVAGFMDLLIPAPMGSSFPSNHSMVSFAAATALCCLPEKGRAITAVKIAAVVTACLIAFSRLYLYVHFPSDIAVGAVLGIAFGFASVALAKRLRPPVTGDGAKPPL